MVTIRPEIMWNQENCGDPRECLACIRACPHAVLAYKPFDLPEKVGDEPQDWRIVGTTRVLCTNCGLCVEACPKDAIQVSIPAE
ncbi:MAG: 4Fe-4S dicluster domain-containing protein [Candidatus Lokiarchaeia archaeon]